MNTPRYRAQSKPALRRSADLPRLDGSEVIKTSWRLLSAGQFVVIQSSSLIEPGTERLADLWYALALNHLGCLKGNERLSYCPISGLVFERLEPAGKHIDLDLVPIVETFTRSPARCLESFWLQVCQQTLMIDRVAGLIAHTNSQAEPPTLIAPFQHPIEAHEAADACLSNSDWQVWLTRPAAHRSYCLQTPIVDLPLALVFAEGGREIQESHSQYSPIKHLFKSLLKTDFGDQCQAFLSVGLQPERGLVWLRQRLDETDISSKALSQEIEALRQSTDYFMKQLLATCSAVH